MRGALLFFFITISVILVMTIMLQQSKAADTGFSSGGNVLGTLFGSSGSANFMTRTTAILAALFFITSLALGNINSNTEVSKASDSNSELKKLSTLKTEPIQTNAQDSLDARTSQ